MIRTKQKRATKDFPDFAQPLPAPAQREALQEIFDCALACQSAALDLAARCPEVALLLDLPQGPKELQKQDPDQTRLDEIERIAGSDAAALRACRRRYRQLRQRFAATNLRMVAYGARRYAYRGEPVEDMFQAGVFGLLKAIDRFDPDRELRFSTYAIWWIRHAITRHLADFGKTVRIPVHIQADHRDLAKAGATARRTFGRPATEEELQKISGLAQSKIEQLRKLGDSACVTLNKRTCDDGDGYMTFLDLLKDESALNPEDERLQKEQRQQVRDAIGHLPPMLRDVTLRYYGFTPRGHENLREIGGTYNLSRERIRQLRNLAEERLHTLLRCT